MYIKQLNANIINFTAFAYTSLLHRGVHPHLQRNATQRECVEACLHTP